MKIVKLDNQIPTTVTIELSVREMNVMRDMLNRSVAVDEKYGLILNIHEGSRMAVQLHQKHRS